MIYPSLCRGTIEQVARVAPTAHVAELAWILLAVRAVRIRAEILMHTNALTVTEAVDYMIAETP